MLPIEIWWIPEYRFFATDAEVEAALDAIGANRTAKRRAIYAAAPISALAVVSIQPIARLMDRLALPPLVGQLLLFSLMLAAIVVVVASPWQRCRTRRQLRAYLLARGVPVCVGCGYDLRGLDVPRCPECGAPFSEVLLERKP